MNAFGITAALLWGVFADSVSASAGLYFIPAAAVILCFCAIPFAFLWLRAVAAFAAGVLVFFLYTFAFLEAALPSADYFLHVIIYLFIAVLPIYVFKKKEN